MVRASPTGDASRQQHSFQLSHPPPGSLLPPTQPILGAPILFFPSLLRMSFAFLQSQMLYFLQIEIFLRDKGTQNSVEPQQRGILPGLYFLGVQATAIRNPGMLIGVSTLGQWDWLSKP